VLNTAVQKKPEYERNIYPPSSWWKRKQSKKCKISEWVDWRKHWWVLRLAYVLNWAGEIVLRWKVQLILLVVVTGCYCLEVLLGYDRWQHNSVTTYSWPWWHMQSYAVFTAMLVDQQGIPIWSSSDGGIVG
jgi:hypothetical protein